MLTFLQKEKRLYRIMFAIDVGELLDFHGEEVRLEG